MTPETRVDRLRSMVLLVVLTVLGAASCAALMAVGKLGQVVLMAVWPWIVEHSDGLLFALMMTVIVWLVVVIARSK